LSVTRRVQKHTKKLCFQKIHLGSSQKRGFFSSPFFFSLRCFDFVFLVFELPLLRNAPKRDKKIKAKKWKKIKAKTNQGKATWFLALRQMYVTFVIFLRRPF
jgi:hypothetical protein